MARDPLDLSHPRANLSVSGDRDVLEKPYVNRRSFLARVVGTSLLGGGALSVVVGNSHAQQNLSRSCLTDRDSSDRPDYGRQTGLTDTDPTDSAGRGTLTNRTDSDVTDAENRGRSWRCANRTGVTDGDSGASADLAGFGLGRRTGVTDSDSGANADRSGRGRGGSRAGASDNDPTDRAGYGRGSGRSGVTDSDSGANADAAGSGRGGSQRPTVAEATEPSQPSPPSAEESARDSSDVGFPNFPWPPPRPSEQLRLPRGRVLAAIGGNPSLYDVGQHLTAALDRTGYSEHSFYRAPKGFALISRLERIENDGRPAPGTFRYMPPGQEPFSLTNYLSGLFVAPVGYYRLIVFVATDAPIVATGDRIDQREANDLLREGADRLPPDFRRMPFGPDHEITALIYEFQKTGQASRLQLLDQGRLGARVHLDQSGLYRALVQRQR